MIITCCAVAAVDSFHASDASGRDALCTLLSFEMGLLFFSRFSASLICAGGLPCRAHPNSPLVYGWASKSRCLVWVDPWLSPCSAYPSCVCGDRWCARRIASLLSRFCPPSVLLSLMVRAPQSFFSHPPAAVGALPRGVLPLDIFCLRQELPRPLFSPVGKHPFVSLSAFGCPHRDRVLRLIKVCVSLFSSRGLLPGVSIPPPVEDSWGRSSTRGGFPQPGPPGGIYFLAPPFCFLPDARRSSLGAKGRARPADSGTLRPTGAIEGLGQGGPWFSRNF